jgi:hypothetical protein
MKSDEHILFSRIRSVALRYDKAPKFKAWLKKKNPNKDFHHVCASTMGRRSTDYLAVLVSREEHSKGQDDIGWLIDQLPEAINNLLQYVSELENSPAHSGE